MDLEILKIYVRLIGTTFAKYRFRMLLLTVIGFVNSSLDVLGVGILIPLFSLFMHDANAESSFITRTLIQSFSFLHVSFNLYSIIGVMVALIIAKAVGEFFVVYLRVRITTDFENEMRADLYRKTLGSRWQYLLKQKIGYLESVIMGDVGVTNGVLKQFCSLAPSFMSFALYIAVAIRISSSTTIAALIFGGFLLLILRPLIGRLKKYVQRQAELQKAITHRINENVGGMKTLKAMGLEEKVAERENSAFEKLRHLAIKSSFVQQLGTSVIEPFTFIFVAVMLVFSYRQPQFSLANFAVVMFLVQRIFNSVRKTLNSWNSMARAIPNVKYVLQLIDEVQQEKEEDNGQELFEFRDEIRFVNVAFAYAEHASVLSDVSFTVKKREMVGIIGPSGAGKTTIVDLMLRFFSPTQGQITIDGKNMEHFSLKELRKRIGYMSQDIFLMNGTVADNIKFFRDDITDEEMIRASKLANAHAFIQELPNGFDSFIGERGVLLSGGQRQRIVLARILASRPEIIILDEATSALDTESEIMIKKALEDLRKEVTIVIIAHRLSTIMGVNHLIVLEKGHVVEEGNPTVLLEDHESYFYKVKSLVESGEITEILK